MTNTQNPNRLQTQLAHMIALEAAIEQRLEELIPEVSVHTGVTALLKGFQTLTRTQRQALETRLQTIADAVPSLERNPGSPSRRRVESRSRLSCLDSAADNLHYVQSGSLWLLSTACAFHPFSG